MGERGQASVEWVAVVAVLALAFAGLAVAGAGVPGAGLARAIAARLLCGAALVDECGDAPRLVAAYGTEVAALLRRHTPTLVFERGSRALPVDFRRCRFSRCADGARSGLVARSRAGLPVTAFTRVIDCRPGGEERAESEGADCSGPRAGSLYLQWWLYYADSATLRGVPVAGERGYHRDDWEMAAVRIAPDGSVAQRASSHHGFNYAGGPGNWGSDAGVELASALAEALGARRPGGWGPRTGLHFVSGGSHAGAAAGGVHDPDAPGARYVPGRRIRLVPLEPIAAATRARFAVTSPWRKRVWRDPEATRTD